MNVRMSVVFAATMLLAGCRGSEAPGLQPTVTSPPIQSMVAVSGRVLDFKTNAGVANAAIKFYTPPLDASAAMVVTDAAGYYSLMLPPGNYNPRINGDMPDSNRGTIHPVGTSYLADYFINGGNCVMLYGTIRNATSGALIAGATVTFLGRTQISGSDASYRLDLGCPTGSLPFGTGTTFMMVSSAGYVTQQPYGNRAEFITADGLRRIDVNLQPASSVSLRQTGGDGLNERARLPFAALQALVTDEPEQDSHLPVLASAPWRRQLPWPALTLRRNRRVPAIGVKHQTTTGHRNS